MKRPSLAAAFIVSLFLLSAGNGAQAPIAAVTLAGRVVADDTGVPLPNVRVMPSFGLQGAPLPLVMTDGDGRFSFSYPRGLYNVSAVKTGYARREVPVPSGGEPIEIRLRTGAVISGRVTDESGAPVMDARVSLETPPANGRDGRMLVSATTDDLGEYRIAGLSEGAYLAVVTTRGRPTLVTNGAQSYMTNVLDKVYYPGAGAADTAQPLALRPGEERQGVDFLLNQLQAMEQPFMVDAFIVQMVGNWAVNPSGTGVIRGRILDSSGRGLPDAHVLLTPPSNRTNVPVMPRMARSGIDGRFEFAELAPGRYRVLASKVGYLPLNADARLPDGTPRSPLVEVVADETHDRIDIPLTRFSTLVGRVLDEYGAPVMGARVQVLHVRYEGGRRKLVAVSVPERVTDDHGAFRLYGLDQGQYLVSAFIGDVSSDDVPGYARTYFPGSAVANDAQFVAVGAGQNVVGLDIPLVRTPTATISGRFLNAQGEPGGGSLTLTPTWRAGATPAEAVGARILRDGQFEFRNVPPGEYVIQASRGRMNPYTEGEFVAVPVAVDGTDLSDLVVQTRRGSSVTGRVIFNSRERPDAVSSSAIEITAVPVDPDRSPSGGWANARVRADGTFDMFGLSGPRRLTVLRAPNGWTLEEIRVGGVDATDRPLDFGRPEQSLINVEVVLTDRVSQLSGTVTDESNRPIAGAHVIVFAADPDRWYWRSRFLRDTTTDDQGGYRVTGLPFGTYYMTTASQVSQEGPEAWQDPAFLTAQISSASSLTISEGQRVTRSIRVSSR
jgi:protocatechuate 3,4-dioxygenase beta subunit